MMQGNSKRRIEGRGGHGGMKDGNVRQRAGRADGVRANGPEAPAFNLVVCDGAWPEEGKRLETALKKRLPGCHQLIHGSIDATLAVHLGPHLLGCGVQFLRTPPPAV